MNDKRDFRIDLLGSGKHERHMHSAIQLLYAAEGVCEVDLREKHYIMHREDVLLINAMEPHAFRIQPDGLAASIMIEYHMITDLMPEAGGSFLLNSMEDMTRPYNDIRTLFHEIIYLESTRDRSSKSRIYRDIYELLDILLTHCMVRASGKAADERNMNDDEKLQQIVGYVNAHFQESFSLTALAKSMYVSTSTLSRFFRKQTGTYFADYVNSVRLSYAIGEMRYTDKSLTRIAADCGFSNASVFAKLFHQEYGMSPTAWRKKDQEETKERQKAQEAIRTELLKRFQPSEQAASAQGNESLAVNVSESRPCGNPFTHVLTIGSLADLTRANVQFHLLTMTRELHITHVRVWGIFSEELRITDGKTIGSYNYSALDTVFDMLVENRLSVYFDLGDRPDMAVSTMSRAVYVNEHGIRFPSRRAYEALFEDFIAHLANRYGQEEVSRWIFDFNEDPSYRGVSRYYEDPGYDFMNVWEFGYRTIRRNIPGAKIGGPSAVPNKPGEPVRRFLEETAERNCPPDFLSIILLPYQYLENDEVVRNPDPGFERRELERVHQTLAALSMPALPVYVTDWNMSVSTRNFMNDTCFRGAYLASRVSVMLEYTDLVSVWVASDWVSSYYDSHGILNGGGGMLTRDGIRKPAYYALQFMSRLGNTLLYADERLVVTRRGRDSYMILAVNSTPFHVSYFLRDEDRIGPGDTDQFMAEGEPAALKLRLKGLEDGSEYIIKTRSMSRRHGSVLDEWKRFRFETQLERADVKYLHDICVPHMSMERAQVSSHMLEIRIVLDVQEFQLIHVYRK